MLPQLLLLLWWWWYDCRSLCRPLLPSAGIGLTVSSFAIVLVATRPCPPHCWISLDLQAAAAINTLDPMPLSSSNDVPLPVFVRGRQQQKQAVDDGVGKKGRRNGQGGAIGDGVKGWMTRMRRDCHHSMEEGFSK